MKWTWYSTKRYGEICFVYDETVWNIITNSPRFSANDYFFSRNINSRVDIQMSTAPLFSDRITLNVDILFFKFDFFWTLSLA